MSTTEHEYAVILSNDVDSHGFYRAELLVDAVTKRVFFDRDREAVLEACRAWVAWDRNHDASVEMIDL